MQSRSGINKRTALRIQVIVEWHSSHELVIRLLRENQCLPTARKQSLRSWTWWYSKRSRWGPEPCLQAFGPWLPSQILLSSHWLGEEQVHSGLSPRLSHASSSCFLLNFGTLQSYGPTQNCPLPQTPPVSLFGTSIKLFWELAYSWGTYYFLCCIIMTSRHVYFFWLVYKLLKNTHSSMFSEYLLWHWALF